MPLQHYIPAAFLANFSPSIQTPRRASLISVGDKLTGKIFTTSVSKVAAIQDLYTLFSSSNPSRVDEAMGDYESDLVFAIDGLINDNLSAFTWAKVLVPFIVGYLVRGPDFGARFLKRFEKFKDFSVSVFESLRGFSFSDNTNLARIREQLDLLAPVMAAKWILLETHGSTPLIINDLGYIGMKGSDTGNIAQADLGPAFPIGVNHILAIIPQARRKIAVERNGVWLPVIERKKLLADNHIEFNTLIGTYAYRFIFGSNEELIRQNLVREKRLMSYAAEPNQLGFIHNRQESVIGIEYYKVLDKLAKPPKSRGAWVKVDLT